MKSEILVIEPGLAEKNYWKDIWRYRELFLVLAWRDVAVRYKQTVIGILWALIQPLLTMIVFTVIFSKIAGLKSIPNVPYPLMVYVGLLPWQFFAGSLSGAANSLIENSNLISKIYFPRMVVPFAAIVVSFIDFLISFTILVGLLIYYNYLPSWQIIMLPIFVILGFLASLGPGLFITALNVKYRDFRYVIPFLIQFGLYISPIGFSSNNIPGGWYRLIYYLNPIVGVIDGFRWSIFGETSTMYIPGFLLSLLVIFSFLIIGINRFRSLEKNFADLL